MPINQQQRSRNRYRPITSADNAATTGLAVNPVGAMIPVSDPTNGAYGGLGQFASMNPVGYGSSPNPNNPYLPAVQAQGQNSYQFQPQNAPRQYQPYVSAVQVQPNFSTANSFYAPPQTNFSTGNSFYTPPQINRQSGNSFTSGAGGVNMQPGLNNNQFVAGLGERLLQNPAEFDNLPKSAQDAITQALGGDTSSGVNADPANSPNGRFIQVGEVRWERNKNGRLVRVQYTGGGSWRNKRVVQGGKGQAKRRLAAGGRFQQDVQPGSSNIPSYGVVNMSLNTGTG